MPLQVNVEPPDRDETVRRVTEAVLGPDYKLPTLPGTAADIMRLANTADVAFKDVDRIVRRDPIIAARVLAVANSPAFSSQPRVMSLRTSMMVLGWHNLRDVLWQVVAEAQVFRGGSRRFLQRLRVHAVGTAHITRMLCRLLSIDTEQSFVAGLLHDIGRPLALELLPPDGLDGLDPQSLLTAVHTQVGYRIADAWNLPVVVAQVARDHHDDPGSFGDEPTPMALVVAAAERIGDHHGLGHDPVTLDPADPGDLALFERIVSAPATWSTSSRRPKTCAHRSCDPSRPRAAVTVLHLPA